VDDLQELSRVEDRAYQLDLRPLDCRIPRADGDQTTRASSRFKRIISDLELTPNLPPILADEDRAIHILTILTATRCNTRPMADASRSPQNGGER